MADPIVVRLTAPVGGYGIGAELGFRDIADATRILGAGNYTVVREQDGDLINPPTPEELSEAEKQAIARTRAARLVRGADIDPLTPGPGEVIVGSADGPVAVPVEEIGGGGTAPVELPSIPGLLAHFDAADLTAIDGARLGAWTDQVTGTTQAVQATDANQPAYATRGINGRPALYFNTGRNDRLVLSGLSATSPTPTVFLAMRVEPPPAGAASRYAFGTNVANNIFTSTLSGGSIGIQQGAAPTKPAPIDAGVVFGTVFSGPDASMRINGVRHPVALSTGASAPTTVIIGHRSSGAAGAGFSGWIGEVLYYDRPLSSDEAASVEAYLAAKWAVPITPQAVFHVGVNGSDANTGRSSADRLATIGAAWARAIESAVKDVTIVIDAPEDAPLRTSATLVNATKTIRLRSATADPFHLYGSKVVSGGWTHEGSGVYSQTMTLYGVDTTNVPILIPTLLDTFGQPTRIMTLNTTTPTTPAAGEYGRAGGKVYVHLPGNADPNRHRLEFGNTQYLIQVHSGALVTITDGFLMGAYDCVVRAGSVNTGEEGGRVVAARSTAQLAFQNGWSTVGGSGGIAAVDCAGFYCNNDGFNHHGATGHRALMDLTRCEGAWNGDEGVSPHGDTLLILRGGRFHHNGHGGLTSVGRAEAQVVGTEFDHNRVTDTTPTGWDSGGVSALEQSRLTSTDLYSHDNPGPGIEIDTAAGATWTDNGGTRSENNGAADVV